MALENYIYRITSPLDGQVYDLFAQNDDPVFQKSRQDDFVFYRHTLDTSLIFKDEDYGILKAIEEDTAAKCEKIPVQVFDGAILVIEGYLGITEAKPYPDRKHIEIKMVETDEATCFLEEWKTKLNVLDASGDELVKVYPGELETRTGCLPVLQNGIQLTSPILIPLESWASTDCLPGGVNDGSWAATWLEFTNITDDGSGNGTFQATVRVEWTSVRLPNGNYQLPDIVLDSSNESLDLSIGTNNTLRYIYKVVGLDSNYDNGRTLENVLQLYADQCGSTVRSDFLNINPVGDAPVNTAYAQSALWNQNIYVHQKTDITRANVSNNATRLEMTHEQVAKQLRVMWDIYPKPEAGNVIRWEHSTFYFREGVIALDISGRDEITGLDGYEYQETQTPLYREYAYMEECSGAFAGESYQVKFPVACSNGDTETLQADRTNNDIRYITEFTVSDTGMVFTSTEDQFGENIIRRRGNPGSTSELINGQFTFRNLVSDFHTFRQTAATYTDGVITYSASSLKPVRKQQTLVITGFSLADWLAFDPNNGLVRTQLGDCEVETARWQPKNNTLTLDLLF